MARKPLSTRAETARRRLAALRFGVLGSALGATIFAVMVLTPLARVEFAVQALISIPMLASLYAVSSDLRVTIVLGGAIAVLAGLSALFAARGDTWLLIADVGLRGVLLAAIIGLIAREVLGQVRISLDTILGGICIYLMLGFFYAHLYVMLELANNGALLSGGHPIAELSSGHPLQSVPAVVYYSYATVTTVAYGDITPATPLARFVAMTEAMMGQLYPTIFIARLVSLNVAQTYSAEE
jgi:hypothetical protein